MVEFLPLAFLFLLATNPEIYHHSAKSESYFLKLRLLPPSARAYFVLKISITVRLNTYFEGRYLILNPLGQHA
ncbi:hypothetical protein DL95DRAFT_395654 [Leptodontidium sp. 2 PMI_412]|nr:hypothetical protein DL95DRAFT_395654 [Leptodontidium sp. 2 PMI_412]